MSEATLILASSSPYRRALLDRLGLRYACVSPDIDEQLLPGEAPRTAVARLAEAKARSVAAKRRGPALIIGCDQLAVRDGKTLGKPGGREANIAQLESASGRWVQFLTGLCLLNAATDHRQLEVVEFEVEFRTLEHKEVERYVDLEQPFDCAGGFKAEGLGIALFKRMRGDDPSALIGLPLICLRRMLAKEGVSVP